MSKAFTTNDEGVPEPPKRSAVRLARGETRYITEDGKARLSEELELLRARAKDPDVLSRIAQLSSLLELLTVAPALTADVERVVFGAWVELEDDEGVRAVWQLVGPDEADPSARRVSVASPLAKALLGKSAGDEAVVPRPRGPTEITVLRVSGRRFGPTER